MFLNTTLSWRYHLRRPLDLHVRQTILPRPPHEIQLQFNADFKFQTKKNFIILDRNWDHNLILYFYRHLKFILHLKNWIETCKCCDHFKQHNNLNKIFHSIKQYNDLNNPFYYSQIVDFISVILISLIGAIGIVIEFANVKIIAIIELDNRSSTVWYSPVPLQQI